ncbi:MAG: SH3 domain-containing protein [Candidatus Muirbacterium halophilum]|nr:SH3 domain-containing protein [Candidatus Muirbacterium halophilum]MCK9474354.1 SH3 domain-containing protein [Candidatus Muirbacterium halophilum]
MIALKDYRKSTDENIFYEQDEICIYTKKKSPWPGFRWCVKENGKRAWVPIDYIEFGEDFHVKIKKDYYSGELDIKTGEKLAILEKSSSWYYCKNAIGERGWVPGDVFFARKERKIKHGTKLVRKRI